MDLKKINLIKKVLASQEFKTVTTDCEQDTKLIPFFSFPDTKEILQNFTSNSSISQKKAYSDSKNNVIFDFKPNSQVLLRIYQNSNWDDIIITSSENNLQALYSKYALFSFAKIYIDDDPNLKSEIFIPLIQAFTKLKKIQNTNIQTLLNEAFSYLFLEFLHSFDKKSFELIFPSLSDFLFSESYDNQIFSLIPDILHILIREYGFDFDSITANFASLIQMILVDKLTNSKLNDKSNKTDFEPNDENTENQFNNEYEEITEETMIVQKIFNCCQPFFLKLSDCALNLLCYLPKFLDENKIDAFFFQFPFCFEQFIESKEKPFISVPPTDKIYQFTPIQSPSSLSQFYDKVITFPKGLPFYDDIENSKNQNQNIPYLISDKYNDHFKFELKLNNNVDYSDLNSQLLPFMSSELISKIITVLKILDDNKEKYSLKHTILNSFCELIKLKKDSPKIFDYVTLFIHILLKLPGNENDNVPFPTSILFDPSYIVTPELHLLRLCSIGALLNFNLKTLEYLLREVIKYPLIITEIGLIFIELGDLFSKNLLKSLPNKFFRIFKEIGAVYQYEDIHSECDRELIETPRIILLSLLSKEFKYKDIAKIVMKDTITIHFFLSHLFEVNLQPFMFKQLSLYIANNDVSDEFVQMLNQLFMQIVQLMPNKKGVKLITNLLSVIIKNSRNLKLFMILNDTLCRMIDKLEIKKFENENDEESNLDLSWKFMDTIFTLLISYSMSNIKIPQRIFDSIERVLVNFSLLSEESIDFIDNSSKSKNKVAALNIKIFEKLIQLLSGTFISKYELIFDTAIVNFEVLKILFTVFQNSEIINIFNFCLKFCCFSNLNCIECHNCGFDSLLLNYIQKNREEFKYTRNISNLKKNPENVFLRSNSDSNLDSNEVVSSNIYIALMTVFEIMSIASSPSIVQQVISLFTPVNNHCITHLHPVLVKKIEEMLINEKNSPNITISLIQSHSFKLNMETSFTFICWIYVDSSVEATLLNIKCGDLPPFLSIAIGKQLIYVNKICSFVQVPKNRWVFLTVSFINNQSKFNVELGLESIVVKKIDNIHVDDENVKTLTSIDNSNNQKSNNNDLRFTAVIGGNGSNSGRIGNFAILPLIDSKTMNNIFSNGPRSNEKESMGCVPFYYADDLTLRKLNMSSINYQSEEKTFSSILLNSFEIETFLPLYAQLDFTFISEDQPILTFKATDLANLLKAAFAASSIQRNQDFDFSILAHILINSNSKHLTCELYKIFYSIYIQHLISINSLSDSSFVTESNQQFLKCLMNKIITNFELWYSASSEEHEKIIDFIKEQKIISFLPQLLIILRMYYWYEPLLKLSSPSTSSAFNMNNAGISKHFVEHGLPDTERPRDPNLNIKKCRRALLSIFLPESNQDMTRSMNLIPIEAEDSNQSLISSENNSMNYIKTKSNSVSNLNPVERNDILNEDDFVLIVGHCILIITTTRDPYQVYDLLDFLQHAKFSFISTEKLFLLHKLLLNELSDDTVICMTIGVIISMHKQIHYTNGFNISNHIEIIFSIVSRRPLSGNSSSFLESLIGMINECPDLFELCSFLSMQRKESILYHRIKPSPLFCARKTWAFWAVINSMIISPKNDEKKTGDDEFESSFILNFLIRCRADDECWFSIFDSIRIASLVFTEFHYFDHRTRFLALLGNYVLKNSSNLSDSCIEAAFMMIAFSILFRKHLKSDPISKQLKRLYNQSPFYFDEQFFKSIKKKDKISFDNFAYPYEICDVLHAQSENGIKVDLTFGLKIDDDFHWVDSNLAELALSISIRFRGKNFYKASILIASFLLSSSYGRSTESGYHKFIQWWFDEMNFSMKDKETNFDFFNFFYGKFNGTQAQIPDWNNLTKVIDWDLVLSHTIGLVDSLNKQFGSNNPYSDNNILFLKEISSSYSQSSSLVLPSDLPDSLRKQKQNLQNSFSINYLFDSSYSDEFCLEIDRIIHKIVESIAQFKEDGMKRWELLWSNMTLIGGAWNFSCAQNKEIIENKENNNDETLDTLDNIARISSSSKNISDSKPKWKREFVMTSFYCPMKLKKNKRFNPHIEAAITREIGNYSNAKQLVRAYRGKIEDQYRQQTQKTLLSLSDEFEQALNRSTSVETVLKSKEENNNDLNDVKRSLSMPKMEQNENDSVMLVSNDPMSEVDDTRTSTDLTSSQSSPSSSIASSNFLFKQQLKQQKKLKKESKKSSIIKCELIKATKDVLGIFSINEKDLFILISPPSSLLISSNFVSPTTTTEKVVATKTYRIPIRRISEIFMRKRFQHSTAIEIFCIDGKSYFINFKSKETSIKVVENISKCIKYNINNNNENKVENLDLPLIFKSSLINQSGTFLKLIQKNYNFIDFFEQQQYTTKWVEGEMSNFEYLIKLNIFSGRSFTDLSLYPIFPWIISKFDCKTLDLNDPEIFRDLTKPIGAIGEDRLNELIERMEEMKFANQQMRLLMRRKSKPVIKNNSKSNKASGNGSMEQPPIGSSLMNLNDNFEEPYLYFSYVICPLAVFLYLIRMEPFTTLHIKMQSNKFDHGSRIFSSISGSYNSAVTSLNNYKELPPDFFFSPEVLVNENGFDLGKNKRGIIDDVELPNWVHFNDSFEFVYILRKALESDYVSSFLPDWIDLMWGYKQKGEEAVKANNIYSSQLYDNIWETHPKTLKNPGKKAEIEATLCHVGQIPPQLFREKHPKRETKVDSPLFTNLSLVNISNDEQKRNEKVISAFISFEKDNIVHLSISSTYEPALTSTTTNSKKKHRKLVSTRKIDLMINDDKSVRILKESDYFAKNMNPNSTCVKFFADDSCFLLLGGKLFHPFGVSLQEKVSSVAFNDGYMAAVVDNDSTVLLFGPELTEEFSVTDNMNNLSNSKAKESNSSFSFSNFVGKPIKFYGEKVVCCDISYTFKVVVCGTSSGHFFICSLFDSAKINVVNLNENYDKKKSEKARKSDIFVPRKIMISKAWGFIVCYAESVPRSISNDRSNLEVKNYDEESLNDAFNNDDGFDSNFFDSFDRRPEIGVSLSNRKHSIFVFNINGRFLRKIDIGFGVSSWCTWMSRKAFDYVAFGTDDGRLLAFEAYSLTSGDFIDNKSDIEKWKINGSFVCLFSDQERAQIVSCSEKKGTVVAVTADCRLVFAPIPSDFV